MEARTRNARKLDMVLPNTQENEPLRALVLTMCGGNWDDEEVVETFVPPGAQREVGDERWPPTPRVARPTPNPRLALGPPA
eukprot:2420736-Pyramimonas_sp.AAC.1